MYDRKAYRRLREAAFDYKRRTNSNPNVPVLAPGFGEDVTPDQLDRYKSKPEFLAAGKDVTNERLAYMGGTTPAYDPMSGQL